MKNIFKTSGIYTDIGLLIIRVGLGLSYIIIHGGPKIMGGPEKWADIGDAVGIFGISFAPVFWGFMAAFAEFFGGLSLMLGLLFRPALLLIIITMIVAASQTLSKGDPFSKAAYPLELMVVLMGLIIIGAGKYSLDNLIFNKRKFNMD